MARPKNPNNIYNLTCKVTGLTRKTNPNQFRDLMARYGLTQDELIASYVSSGPGGGRRQIASENLTPEQAIEKYGIHPNVATRLKATVKQKPVDTTAVVIDEVAAEPVDTTEPIVESNGTSFSVSIRAEDEKEVAVEA